MTTTDEETRTPAAIEIETCGRPDCVPCKVRVFLTVMETIATGDSDKGGKYPYGTSLFALMVAGKAALVIAGQSLNAIYKGDVDKALKAVTAADREAGRMALDMAHTGERESAASEEGGCYPAGHA